MKSFLEGAKLVASIAILVMALSIGYYFFKIRPEIENKRLEMQQKQFEATRQNEKKRLEEEMRQKDVESILEHEKTAQALRELNEKQRVEMQQREFVAAQLAASEALRLQNDTERLKLEQKKFEATREQTNNAEVLRVQKENDLNACLKNADDNYRRDWLNICRSKGLLGFSFSTCDLPAHQANRLNAELRSAEKNCAKIYK